MSNNTYGFLMAVGFFGLVSVVLHFLVFAPDPADCRRLERQTHIVAACVKIGSCLVTTEDLRRLDNLQAACAANDK